MLRVLLIKSCRRPSKNTFLESYGQHSKQTSVPGFESLPLRSKAGREVPAQPGGQHGCPKSSQFPLFEGNRADSREILCLPWAGARPLSPSEPSGGTQQCPHRGARPPCPELLQKHPLCAGCRGEGTGKPGNMDSRETKKIAQFRGALAIKVLFLPGQRVIWGEMLHPWPQHPPLDQGGRMAHRSPSCAL